MADDAGRRWSIGRLLKVALVVALFAAFCAWAIWRNSVGRRVHARLAALKAEGLPTRPAEMNAWVPNVPYRENGVAELENAFRYFAAPNEWPSAIGRLLETNVWTAEMRALAKGQVESNRVVVTKVQKALEAGRFKYIQDYSAGQETLLPHLAQVRRGVTLLLLDALLGAEEKDEARCVTNILSAVKLARTLDAEPLLVSWATRGRNLGMAANTVGHALSRMALSDKSCVRLEQALRAAIATNYLPAALAGERAITIDLFGVSGPSAAQEQLLFGTATPTPFQSTLAGIGRGTGFFVRDAEFYLRAVDRCMEAVALPPPHSLKAREVMKEIELEMQAGFFPLSRVFSVGAGAAVVRDCTERARAHMAIAALALERYRRARGELPRTIADLVPQFLAAELIDPFDGEPLRYRKLEQGYLLWSIGEDLQDNDGTPQPVNAGSARNRPYDLTMEVRR